MFTYMPPLAWPSPATAAATSPEKEKRSSPSSSSPSSSSSCLCCTKTQFVGAVMVLSSLVHLAAVGLAVACLLAPNRHIMYRSEAIRIGSKNLPRDGDIINICKTADE